jgi:hypothetical protein
MKQFTSIAIAFLLVLAVIPAMADDQIGSQAVDQTVDKATVSFQALSKLSDTERQSLVPLTETELASIEGALGNSEIGFGSLNLAILGQTNASAQDAISIGDPVNSARQSNYSRIFQKIN